MNQDKTIDLVSSTIQSIPKPANEVASIKEEKEPKQGNSSVGMATIQIINTVVGAGILALPVVMRYLGIFLGSAFFIAMWGATLYSVMLLLKAQTVTQKSTYALIAKSSLGDIGYIIVILMIVLNNFGICCAYFRIFGENIQNIFQAFVSKDSYLVTNWHNYIYVIFIFIIMGLLLFFDSLESLAQVSSLGVMGIFVFMIGLFVIYFYKLSQNFLPAFHGHQFLPSGPFLDLLTSLPTVFLAFSFQFNVFPIYYTLKERKTKPMMKATIIGVSTVLFLYLIIGILGFLLYQHNLTDTILQMLLVDMQQYKDSDMFLKYLLIVSNIGFLCCCTTGIPVMFFSLKENFFSIMIFIRYKWAKYQFTSKLQIQARTQANSTDANIPQPQLPITLDQPKEMNEITNIHPNTSNNQDITQKSPSQENLIDNSVSSLNISRNSDAMSTHSLNTSHKPTIAIEFQTHAHSAEKVNEKEHVISTINHEGPTEIHITPLPKASINNDSFESELNSTTKIITIFIIYGCIGVITLIIPQVKTIFNVIGSTAANATSFIIPSIIIIKLVKDNKLKASLIFPIILLVIGIIILFSCLIGEIINAAK